MSSVIGFDIGQAGSKIGAARNRGIDVLVNEVSNRATPSLVAFGPRSRIIGESAKTQEISNYRNTIGSLKRLIGRTLGDPDVEIEKKFLNAELVSCGNTVGVQVQYLGEKTVFSATQLYAMLLSQLRQTAASELKSAVNDIVIAVPVWYTDVQRRAVRDACEVAGLNPLRLINDTTATALGYGITKTDLPAPEEPPRHIAFVDIGHSDYSVSIVAFNKGKLVVKSTAFDRHFGGRDLDYALTAHFAEEFKGKYKIDVNSNTKALFRLSAAVEKLKKILSANAVAPLSVESIMNDVDASSSISRDDFEALIAPLLERTIAPLEKALAEAGLTKEDIEAVELVGGSTRVPALKNRIQEYFGRPLSFTTNQDEAIARGATLACAILSPVFKVRDFEVVDTQLYPIKVCWEKTPDADMDPENEMIIFDRGNVIPSVKNVTLSRKQPFDIEFRYADPSALPGGVNPWIGKYHVKNVAPKANGEHAVIKVTTKLDINGIASFPKATLYDETFEDVPAEAAPAEQAEGSADASTSAAPAQKKKKVIKTVLPGISGATSLDSSLISDFREKEGQMASTDKLVMETEDRKNALEEYVYDTRDKLDGQWSSYVNSSDKEKLKSLLTEAEDWLYTEEGEDATKSAYVTKLDACKVLGDPILLRYREHDERPRSTAALRETLASFMDKAQSGDDKYSHLAQKDLTTVIETVANAEKWLSDAMAKQAESPKNLPPVVTSAEIRKKKDDIFAICNPILSMPKPKAPKPPTEAPKEDKKEAPEVAPDAEMKDADTPAVDGATNGTTEEMDVDQID